MDQQRFLELLKDAVTANLHTGCAALNLGRSYDDGRIIIREKHRDFHIAVTTPYSFTKAAAEEMGKNIAREIDQWDKVSFGKWEVIPDPSQHSVMGIDGIIKRAGGTPKYVFRKGQYGLLKGMPEGLTMVYDDWLKRQGATTSVKGKTWDGDRWRDLDQEQGWEQARKDVDMKRRALDDSLKQRAAERTAKLKLEREEAAQRQVNERETFYQQATDFGLF